ncbi:MAG: multiprotein bridging factor aMBF1 [Candidatus Micrarchaeia archaeon]|jgi:uncharacterized protein (TIGR00270 family)
MNECEVCGKAEAVYLVLIEGAKLQVCGKCSKMGEIISSLYEEHRKEELRERATERQSKELFGTDKELIEDFGKKILNKIREIGISYHVLAERLNEKESYIERIIQGKTRPDEKLAYKIEKELNIKLFEESSAPASSVTLGKHREITLGDVIEIEKKKK